MSGSMLFNVRVKVNQCQGQDYSISGSRLFNVRVKVNQCQGQGYSISGSRLFNIRVKVIQYLFIYIEENKPCYL